MDLVSHLHTHCFATEPIATNHNRIFWTLTVKKNYVLALQKQMTIFFSLQQMIYLNCSPPEWSQNAVKSEENRKTPFNLEREKRYFLFFQKEDKHVFTEGQIKVSFLKIINLVSVWMFCEKSVQLELKWFFFLLFPKLDDYRYMLIIYILFQREQVYVVM